MLNSVITIKIKERLNKLDSQDYDNIECWQIVEAFNKAQVEWVRRQIHGTNTSKEGDEGSSRRIDDLQILLTTEKLSLNKKDIYYYGDIPADYLEWKRVDVYATKGCCDNRRMMVYLAEEANLNNLLRDDAKKPNFDWAETFCTLKSNTINIYTNSEFELSNSSLLYYRFPRKIEIENCTDPYTGVISTVNVTCELKDDIIELLIDEAASVIAGDIESANQFTRGSQQAERNN
jgi:hypothetical protein